MTTQTRPADSWTPQYFLAALGAGGLATTFFIWLYMWVPHKGQPVPIFEDVAAAWGQGNSLQQAMIVLAYLGMAAFVVLHFKLMIWNLRNYAAFRRSPAFEKALSSNMGSQLLGLPLALAMSINVSFAAGLAFVPGLWSVVEYLFPLALAAFLAVAYLAFRLAGGYLARLSAGGVFDMAKNGSFAQVQPAFAFGMIGVGMAAPAALSGNPTVAAVSLVLSTVLLLAAAIWALVGVVMGLIALIQHGANLEGIPTLMNIVPLMAVLGILTLRQSHGLHVHFGVHAAPGDDLMTLTTFLAVQVLFLGLGITIARKHGYWGTFVTGAQNSAGSYGLICPGVGLAVLMQFWINKALVGAGLLAKFSAAYWALSAITIIAQLSMVALLIWLNRRHFGFASAQTVPAE
jgi:hypothetical protein